MNVLLTPSRLKNFFFTFICPTFYGKPAAVPSNTTSTVTQNSIPAELMPYATTMLSAASQQLYTYDKNGAITGFQPFKPYSKNGADYVAPFSALQKTSQTGAANLKLPGQYAPATTMAFNAGNQSGLAGANFARQAVDAEATAAYMSPYMQNVVNRQKQEAIRDFGISGTQEMGSATQQGAFGGSREAIMAAENQRNMQWKLADIQATGTQNAFQNAQSQQQFGANLGLQGLGQKANAAATLGNIGTAQIQAQQGIIGTQGVVGATQQKQNQIAIDQAVQNYQNAQQQPYTALGTMSSLIRGTPTGNQTTQQYQAQPSALTQIGGALGTVGSLYGASQAGHAEGGIVGYSVGGAVEADLYDLTPEQLQEVIQTATSATERSMAKRILAEKSMANGGIVGFAEGGDMRLPNNPFELWRREKLREEEYARRNEAKQTAANAGIAQTRKNIKDTRAKEAGLAAAKEDAAHQSYEQRNSAVQTAANAEAPKGYGGIGGAASAVLDTVKRGGQESIDTLKSLGSGIADVFHSDTPAATASTAPPADTGMHQDPVNDASRAAGILGDGNSSPELVNMANEWLKVPENQAAYDKYLQDNDVRPLTPTDSAMREVGSSGGIGGSGAGLTTALGSGGPGLPGVNQEVPTEAPTTQDDASIPEPPPEQDLSTYQKQLHEAYAREGIKNPDENAEEYRKRIMQQGLDLRTESERNTYLRMAEFFAHWGSTPGAPLVAGMKALNATMPGYLEDKKDQAKLSRALDESLYKLEAATRLEKLGDVKGAFELKNAASAKMMNVWDLQVKATEAKKTRDNALKVADIYAKAGLAKIPNSMEGQRATTVQRQIDNIDVRMKDLKGEIDDPSKTEEEKKPKREEYARLLNERNRLSGIQAQSSNSMPNQESPIPEQPVSGGAGTQGFSFKGRH